MPKTRKRLRSTCTAIILTFAALAACVSPPSALVSPIATPDRPILETPMLSPASPTPTTLPAAAGRTPQPDVRELAVADLAALLALKVDAITVISVEPVEWNDASLGCPEPDMMYAQVITPGYRIVLEANGQRFEYHTGEGNIVRCKP